ncbi:MAG: hypothetical protein AN484_15490 [Aphanizomenon flos-aquae WA102]|uniref:Uncharacterized protein n=1 Tax=Aphanizomenon flos-aquae WA102 TaxID=1710896 RepID=A0A1B7X0K9_APHFL|nr:MAG: hypothetical protein AN484_15490 [Aphanizomenon flos-aquae WA102]
MSVEGKLDSRLDDGVLVGSEVFVALLGADREGHEGRKVVDGFGGGLAIRGAEFDRGDADGGHDLGGFLGGADLSGFVLGDEGLEGLGLLDGHFEGGAQLGELGVLRRGFDLEAFEFGRGADRHLFHSGAEVVALGGKARDSGGGGEELLFDGHLRFAVNGIRTSAGRR